jgi:hypothetical protein
MAPSYGSGIPNLWRECPLIGSPSQTRLQHDFGGSSDERQHRDLDPRRKLLLGPAGTAAPRDGAISTRVGYTGGENDYPTERNHPGHAEAVEIVFDPECISYRDLLEF